MVYGKSDIVHYISESCGFSKVASSKAVDAVVQFITSALEDGNAVSLVGFGKFETVQRAARECRNPADGSIIQVAAKKAPKFTPGITLKNKVNK